MILSNRDSVFFADDAKGVVGGDRIMEGQNHNDISWHPVRHTDRVVAFGKFLEGHHQAPVVVTSVRQIHGGLPT